MIVFVYFISEVLDYHRVRSDRCTFSHVHALQELVSEILTPEEVDNIRQG